MSTLHSYQMAENLDSQLKQMSEDLKEVIEHLNEANKNQELSNPVCNLQHVTKFSFFCVILVDYTNWTYLERPHEFSAVDRS